MLVLMQVFKTLSQIDFCIILKLLTTYEFRLFQEICGQMNEIKILYYPIVTLIMNFDSQRTPFHGLRVLQRGSWASKDKYRKST